MKKSFLFSCSLFFSSFLLAQTDVKIKDASSNILLQINDEGTSGSLTLPPLTTIESPTGKLYSIGTTLFWGSTALGSAGSAGGWTDAGTNIYNTTLSDKVGIGLSSPNEPLEIAGNGRAFFGDGGGSLRKGLLIDGLDGPTGVEAARLEAYNYSTSSGMNLVINTVGNGNVGIGNSHPLSKLSVGTDGHPLVLISGVTYQDNGTAVSGNSSSLSGTGFGGIFQSSGDNGTGVAGGASGENGIGVQGTATGSKGIAVRGSATNNNSGSNNTNYGGYFESNGQNGIGSFSTSSGSGAKGTYAYVTGSDATAVLGWASGLNGRAIVGVGFLLGYAGWFDGRVNITGTLSKGAGSFKIDHPLDPTNKNLYHSFVESPDMMNIYNGNVATDGNGIAIIELPEWFEALNKDFKYQLTVIGEFAQAIISEKIINNKFSIKTDKPNIEVSWQVTGVRKDAFANANRIQVEELKADKDRGKYLHPEAFNMPSTAGVNYDERMDHEIPSEKNK